MGFPLQTTRLAVREDSAPVLLPHWEPGFRTFWQNLADIFRKSPTGIESGIAPGVFWPDVFVSRRFPWARFALSGTMHLLALALILATGRLWPEPDRVYDHASLSKQDVIYFSPTEYLAPFDSGAGESSPTRGEPAFASQPILSVPANPDNRTQTIVTPPDIKLDREAPVPNVVEWKQSPPLPAVPISAAERPLDQNGGLILPPAVVEPPPSVAGSLSKPVMNLSSQPIGPTPSLESATRINNTPALQTAAVGPPPAVSAGEIRRNANALDMGGSEVVAPAPTVTGQRSPAANVVAGLAPIAIAPAPSTSGMQGATTSGRLIALGIHPASLNLRIVAPNGNRRGAFEAGPHGKTGAAGSPTVEGRAHETGESPSPGNSRGIPAGLRVGPASHAVGGAQGTYPGESQIASVKPETARVTGPASEVPDEKVTEADRQVFGSRRFYSMSLNMPNLNSSGGSWVIRFAELADSNDHGELTAPEAIQKVDPAYPLSLMRDNVQGTVTVSAVIRRDGSVGDVHVVKSIDERLDLYACNALSKWHFQPALKNGAPVDLRAVVLIPFRPSRLKSGF